jgi:hypothetical protein
LIEIEKFDRSAIGSIEFTVLLTEFKAGLNDYLATNRAPATESAHFRTPAPQRGGAAPQARGSL